MNVDNLKVLQQYTKTNDDFLKLVSTLLQIRDSEIKKLRTQLDTCHKQLDKYES